MFFETKAAGFMTSILRKLLFNILGTPSFCNVASDSTDAPPSGWKCQARNNPVDMGLLKRQRILTVEPGSKVILVPAGGVMIFPN